MEELLSIEKLSPLVARQAIRLTRPEAKRLLIARYALKALISQYKAGQTIIKKEYQILPIALDFPRRQTDLLRKQVESLLAWYARGHPAYKWMQSHGINPWLCGGILSVMDSRRMGSAYQLWQYLHLGHNPRRTSDANMRPKVMRRMFDSIRATLRQGKMPFYMRLKLARMKELQEMLVANKMGYIIKHAKPFTKSAKFEAHMLGKCDEECYWKKVLGTTELPPHMPWGACHALAIRQMRQIFFSHLAQVVLVGERGVRWPQQEGWVLVPNTELVNGWEEARLVHNGLRAERRGRPLQDFVTPEWLDG